MKNTLISFIVIALCFLSLPFASADDLVEVHFINVGYGDAILVRMPDKTNILIDAGWISNGERLVKYLEDIEIEQIDYALITHPHENHFGGFEVLVQEFPIKQVFVNPDKRSEDGYDELLELFHSNKIPVRKVQRKDKVGPLEILHPKNLDSGVNESSIVSWLKVGETSFLFTSDIGPIQVKEVLKKYSKVRSSNCIQIPHHGKTVSDEMIDLDDKIWVASTGPNRWGELSFERLQKLRGTLLRTDLHDTVVLVSDGQEVSMLKPKR